MKHNISFFKGLKLYKDIYQAGASVSLSNVKHLKLVFQHVGWRILYLSCQKTRVTNRVRSLHNFCCHLARLRRHHGDLFVIKYLKASQLAIQKKLARKPFTSLRELEPDLPLPRLTKSGLPSFIKLSDRASIVRGALTVIRLW